MKNERDDGNEAIINGAVFNAVTQLQSKRCHRQRNSFLNLIRDASEKRVHSQLYTIITSLQNRLQLRMKLSYQEFKSEKHLKSAQFYWKWSTMYDEIK